MTTRPAFHTPIPPARYAALRHAAEVRANQLRREAINDFLHDCGVLGARLTRGAIDRLSSRGAARPARALEA